MLNKKKAQTAIEFLLLLGGALIFIVAFTATFQHQVTEKKLEKRNFLFQELALTVQNELNIAASASDGYRREFNIPQQITGLDYGITLIENFIYINSTDGKQALSLPAQNATGQFITGSSNVIEKRNGIIYVNSP